MPVEIPSSIQKPIEISLVRISSETATSARSPNGTATRGPASVRVRSLQAGREA
jgi:hypothetical protein